MYLFILGVVFGMGLVLAYKSVAKTIQLRKIHKAHAVELEIQRRVHERTQWGHDLDKFEARQMSRPGPATW